MNSFIVPLFAGPHSAELSLLPALCSGSLLEGMEAHKGYWALDPGLAMLRQTTYTLYYLSSPQMPFLTIFKKQNKNISAAISYISVKYRLGDYPDGGELALTVCCC